MVCWRHFKVRCVKCIDCHELSKKPGACLNHGTQRLARIIVDLDDWWVRCLGHLGSQFPHFNVQTFKLRDFRQGSARVRHAGGFKRRGVWSWAAPASGQVCATVSLL
eukprot:SAG11_NODE_13081_length_671_cov_1.076923_1_plen_107_part_00